MDPFYTDIAPDDAIEIEQLARLMYDLRSARDKLLSELGAADAGLTPDDIDHINGDRTDNRACNLRSALRGYNNANSHKGRAKLYSHTKGVSYDKARAKWVGHVTIHGDTHQRRFATEQEAADWVASKRKELHGEYAKA